MFFYSYVTKTRYIENIGNIDEALKSIKSEYKTRDITREEFVKSLERADALYDN